MPRIGQTDMMSAKLESGRDTGFAIAYLGLGSNMGNREQYLARAVAQLARHPGVEVKRTSSVYQTDPWGYTDQERFLNAVVEVYTTLSPVELLGAAQAAEAAAGRRREVRWGPRTLDVDILLYGPAAEGVEGIARHTVSTDELVIPHPRMWERAFVLVPLAELAPGIRAIGPPADGGPDQPDVGTLAERLRKQPGQGVELYIGVREFDRLLKT